MSFSEIICGHPQIQEGTYGEPIPEERLSKRTSISGAMNSKGCACPRKRGGASVSNLARRFSGTMFRGLSRGAELFKFGAIEVLGLSISPRVPPSPLTSAWIPFQPGLNVLYGLNGAGKSLILEALTEILTRSESVRTRDLHARLFLKLSPDGFIEGEFGAYISSELAPLFKSFAYPGEVDFLDGFSPDFVGGRRFDYCDDLGERIFASVSEGFGHVLTPDSVDRDELLLEVLSQRIIGLGNAPYYPGWSLFAMADDEFPAISNTLRHYWDDPPADQSMLPGGSIEDLWGSVSSEAARQLPQLFSLTYQDWEVTEEVFPVTGGQKFDANGSTALLLQRLHRRHESVAKNSEGESNSLTSDISRLVRADIEMEENPGSAERVLAIRLQNLPWIVLADDGDPSPQCGVWQVCELLSHLANKFYASLLMDAPVLEIRFGGIDSWLSGNGLQWGARRSADSEWVSLPHLSEAERRWADIAIELALQIRPSGFLVIDEPERALHRSAEAFMAKGLCVLAAELGLCVVVASHSTELLNTSNAEIHLVRRADQGLNNHRQVYPLTSADRDALLEFGLLPSDLLRRQRGLLLVEGEHDLIVWNAFLGNELRDLRIEVVPLRGAGRLNATLDSRVLFDFTDAHLFVMLDALDPEVISTIWAEACKLAKTQSAQAAAEFAVQELSALQADEAKALSSWASRALQRGLEGRHTPMALSEPDVLDYLPVESFVPGAHSWNELRAQLARSSGSGLPSGSEFKRWLSTAKGADLSTQHISDVANEMTSVPLEFTDRLVQIRAVLFADVQF